MVTANVEAIHENHPVLPVPERGFYAPDMIKGGRAGICTVHTVLEELAPALLAVVVKERVGDNVVFSW